MSTFWKTNSVLRNSYFPVARQLQGVFSISGNRESICPCCISTITFMQKREMSRVKQRHTHPYFWWPKKRRERNDQEISSDNEAFVKQLIHDKFGPAYTPESDGMPFVNPLKQTVRTRGEWTPSSMRTGVIARKIGVYPIWDKEGRKCPTTLLQVVDNHVVRYLSPEECERNYGKTFKHLGIVIVGAESADPQRFTKEYCGLFNNCGTLPKIKLNRFLVTSNAALQPGTPLYASHFQVGQFVDVAGKTTEHGFQGVMKRWGFHGMPATHGVTKSHRRGGNTGGGGEKGRVWPGTKLPGHMGSMRRMLKGIEILRINTKYNIIYVKGRSIPGETNNFVTIQDTSLPLKRITAAPPFPTFYPEEVSESLPDDIISPDYHNYVEPTVMFEESAEG